ncbi:cyclin-dependent kinase 7 isoform X2 [Pituophis catenifer annectens]|uniref:cyclin-dependent kinase 7 isoform X2 n=1 Tax=Pituophis catenifer annectens TaxID=94852 RepID=UPI003991BA7C
MGSKMAAASRVIQVVKPHTPLIKFPDRKSTPKPYMQESLQSRVPPLHGIASQFSAENKAPSSQNTLFTGRIQGIPDTAELIRTLPQKYRRKPMSVEEMEYIQFATVYKARDKNTNQIVAIKKIKLGHRSEAKDGINRTALREIKLLQELSHPNIIGLLDAFGHKSNISLVFDFMETDLEVIIKDTSLVLTPSHIKAYMLMTLQGLEYLHEHWILHRDLKPNNLLLDENGVLKLADFGLAKSFGSPNRVYTHQVVTRWYRAPELLFGARMYGVGVDMWAVGCILAELLLRVPFLPGDSDLDQLTKIFETLGTPTEEQWPGMTNLPDYVTFKSFPGMQFQHIFSAAGDDLLELLQGLFRFDPCTRLTASQALKHEYFSNRPAPTPGSQLPRPNCPAEALKEQQNPVPNLKRKRVDGKDQGLPKKLVF